MYEIELNNVPVKIWAKGVDPHAMKEIVNLSTLPFVFHHLAFMPDVHGGKGMPIGGVLATRGVVIPNAVGVDIGCGMCAVKTSLRVEDIPSDVLRKQILRGIRKQIPLGFDHHKTAQDEAFMPQGFDIDKLAVVKRQYISATKQVGTLGGGNHFLELQKDTEGQLWIMIHSGSRNLGAHVGMYYNDKAKMLNRRWFSSVNPDIDMAFLPMQSDMAHAYWDEMNYCVEFALCNRRLMMQRICQVIGDVYPDTQFEPMINIAHNYACWENHFDESVIVHRKGGHAGQPRRDRHHPRFSGYQVLHRGRPRQSRFLPVLFSRRGASDVSHGSSPEPIPDGRGCKTRSAGHRPCHSRTKGLGGGRQRLQEHL